MANVFVANGSSGIAFPTLGDLTGVKFKIRIENCTWSKNYLFGQVSNAPNARELGMYGIDDVSIVANGEFNDLGTRLEVQDQETISNDTVAFEIDASGNWSFEVNDIETSTGAISRGTNRANEPFRIFHRTGGAYADNGNTAGNFKVWLDDVLIRNVVMPADNNGPIVDILDPANNGIIVGGSGEDFATVGPAPLSVVVSSDLSIVVAGDVVNLSSTNNYSGNGTITYLWEQIDNNTSVGTITNNTSANASFTVPVVSSAEELEFRLTISDGTETATNTITVLANFAYLAPDNPFTRTMFLLDGEYIGSDTTINIPNENFTVYDSSWNVEDNTVSVRGSKPAAPHRLMLKDLEMSEFSFQTTVTAGNLPDRIGGVAIRAVDETDFLAVYPRDESIELVHFNNGEFTNIATELDTVAIPSISEYRLFISANAATIKVYIDDVLQCTFVTTINQTATKVGINVQDDLGPRFADFIYSNDPTLDSFALQSDSTPPVLTVNDETVTLLVGEDYEYTSTAIDAVDGDISRFIELYDENKNLIPKLDTSKKRDWNLVLKVRDNNFNESIASQKVIVNDGLETINRNNRMGKSTEVINVGKSQMVLTIPNETGFNTRLVQAHKNDDLTKELANKTVEFVDGEATLNVNKPIGFPYTGAILTPNYPHDNGQAISGATIGELVCYANAAISSAYIMPNQGVLAINNIPLSADSGILNFYTSKGASVTYHGGFISYSPHGAFDYLDPDETTTDTFTYLLTGNVTRTVTITIKASEAVGANIAPSATSTSIPATYEEGATYEIAFDVTGRTTGSIQPQAIGDVTAIPRYDYAKNGREVWHIKIPANCTTIDLVGLNGFDGTTDNLHVRELFKPDTVVAPRLLDVKQVNQRQQPTNSEVIGNCVIRPAIVPLLDPSANIGSWTADLNGLVLSNGSRIGFRSSTAGNFRFIDCESYEAKEAVALYEGGDFAMIDNLWAEGGYPESADGPWGFELGISMGNKSNGISAGYVYNTYIDMKKLSINGQYTTQTNTDCGVMNRADNKEHFEQAYHWFNCALANGGDANTDSKCTTLFNYIDDSPTFLHRRGHFRATQIVCNNKLRGYNNTDNPACVPYAPTGTSCRFLLWNCEFEDFRYNNIEEFEDGANVRLTSSMSEADIPFVFHSMKTQPALPDTMLAAFDEIECEYKLSADDTWTALPKISVDHAGDLNFRPTLPSGTYDFRVRTILRTQQSAWVEKLAVVIA